MGVIGELLTVAHMLSAEVGYVMGCRKQSMGRTSYLNILSY